ncbi:MAG: ARC6/PARC6 family protein [Candidatus Obscuribacterales bacterium]|nr:ARC6/PARC6 family protein [Candidatus Obscuribacterales bacterium]
MKTSKSSTETWKAAVKRVKFYSDKFRTSSMLIRIWSLSTALVVVSGILTGIATPVAFADDSEESMESIWADESQHNKPAAPKKDLKSAPVAPSTAEPENKPAVKENVQAIEPTNPPAIFVPAIPEQKEDQPSVKETAETAPVPSAAPQQNAPQQNAQPTIQGDLTEPAKPAPSATAPLSKLDEFTGSHFIKQGGWPGVGPFHRQAGADDVFVDEAGNNLDLHLAGGRIAQATFNLVNKGATYDDFLDLQVASEFLLEGLNVKPKTILEFNQQLEDAKDGLLNQSNTSPITINAGRYITTVNKQGTGDGKFSYVISVVSKDASPDVLKEHSKEAKEQPGRFSFLNKGNKSTDFIIRQNQEKTASPSNNELTETFSKTIQSWQDIKKIAVRQRKTEELSQVLHGNALIRQTDAIKWLSVNHKYYDMNPKGATIDHFSELVPGQKYAVFVEIKEISKLMDDATGQVIKEQDDNYKVNYTLEKKDGQWFITDSKIVDKSSTPSASHPQGKSSR